MNERERRRSADRRGLERRAGERRKASERRAAQRRAGPDRRTAPRRAEQRRDGDRRDAGASGEAGSAEAQPPAGRRITDAGRLDLILDITRKLMGVTDLTALLREIATGTTELVDCDRATVFLVDRENGELWSKVALGADEIRFPLGTGIAGTVAATGRTVNIPDAYADPRFNQDVDRRTGYRTHNLLTFPMTGHDGSVIGVFQAVNKRGGPFTNDDQETLASLAASAGVCVENAQLVDAQRQLWMSLVETLAVTVDARDQQTAGHSRRVTRYAEVIAASVGLSPAEIDRVRTAGLLHDYGKIAVRDRFLQKAGKLDDAEFAYMKEHAEKTGEFLRYLRFPPDMREVPLMAAQHHERMDGKGYPLGLAGDQITVGARIVAAADVFDALTAPRYYKPAYPIEKTMEIMRAMSGEHLDPTVFAAVERALPRLIATIEELRSTWPKPGDEGMGSIGEAAQLSERDQAAVRPKPASSGGAA